MAASFWLSVLRLRANKRCRSAIFHCRRFPITARWFQDDQSNWMIDVRPSRLNFPRHARRGSIYVFVLATAMLLTIIGMMVLTTSQISARSTYNANDSIEAAVLAESAVDYALQQIANDSNWRSDYTNNVIVTPAKNLGHGSITFKLADDAT